MIHTKIQKKTDLGHIELQTSRDKIRFLCNFTAYFRIAGRK